jgi:spectinomycin phosphotransferase
VNCVTPILKEIVDLMLEKPNLEEERIITCLQNEYGLGVDKILFLPLGADQETAVYHVMAIDKREYFVKLRKGDINKAVVSVPNYLNSIGIKQVIPSLTTQTGQFWANLDSFKVILYPYVGGNNGFEEKMSEQHWIEFGRALKSFHTAVLPSERTRGIRRETFSPKWRETVRSHLSLIENKIFADPVAVEMAAFLQEKGDETLEIIERAERLALALQEKPPDFILCHGDIHGWNLLIDVHGALYLVDWDTLIYAPKERDLMFIGGGLGESGYTPEKEEAMFYKGYGQTNINQIAIVYYRYERIIEDIAVFCEQIFLSEEGGKDRKKSLGYLKSNYLPNSTIEVARKSDKAMMDDQAKVKKTTYLVA